MPLLHLSQLDSLEHEAIHILRETAEAGRIALANPDTPEVGSGWIVLGMGKFGAGELNYSSDIDLIVLFDESVAPVAEGVEPQVLFVRMTQRLVALLQEHTADDPDGRRAAHLARARRQRQ